MISLFSIVALGFFLGMRHATDPDHVIAVTTIVSRYRKVSHAAVIGALWGVGHTLTILLVGSGIILFGWVIPARIGLSMEFSVGLMLMLLGVLSLTGMLQWITNTFSSAGGISGRLILTLTATVIPLTPTRTNTIPKLIHTHQSTRPWAGSIAISAGSVSIKPCGLSSWDLSTASPARPQLRY